MTQPKYLILRDKKPLQVDLVGVGFRPLTKIVRTIKTNFGPIGIQRPTGKVDKSILEISTNRGIYPVRAEQKSVSERIRMLTDSDADTLDRLDDRIAELRNLRQAVLDDAWRRAIEISPEFLVEKVEKRKKK